VDVQLAPAEELVAVLWQEVLGEQGELPVRTMEQWELVTERVEAEAVVAKAVLVMVEMEQRVLFWWNGREEKYVKEDARV
jgi:hypothetical protein